MVYYLFTCRSLTYAQRTAKTLERAGITAILMRSPQRLSAGGCGYSVKVPQSKVSDALVVLKNAELNPIKVFVQYADGNYDEVAV